MTVTEGVDLGLRESSGIYTSDQDRSFDGSLSGPLGVVLIRCKKCGALYQTGVYMDKKNYESQARSMMIVRVCPYCRTSNSSMTAQLVFQGT